MAHYNLVTRAGWNARQPKSTFPLSKSRVVNFIIHYYGARRDQSVRSIQDYCMDTKGHSDIDYNELVRGRDRYQGRLWNAGGHTLNNNSTSYGVCIIGLDGDATNDDFIVVREIYDEICAELGRELHAIGHNQAPTLPPGYTSCPGSEIQNWINSGMPMPYIPEDDMADESVIVGIQKTQIDNIEYYFQSLFQMTESAKNISNTVEFFDVPNAIGAVLKDIQAKVSEGAVTGITEARLREIIREEIAKTRLS